MSEKNIKLIYIVLNKLKKEEDVIQKQIDKLINEKENVKREINKLINKIKNECKHNQVGIEVLNNKSISSYEVNYKVSCSCGEIIFEGQILREYLHDELKKLGYKYIGNISCSK